MFATGWIVSRFPHFRGSSEVQACSSIRLARVMACPLHNPQTNPPLELISMMCEPQQVGQLCATILERFAMFVWTATIVSQDFNYAPSRVTDPH